MMFSLNSTLMRRVAVCVMLGMSAAVATTTARPSGWSGESEDWPTSGDDWRQSYYSPLRLINASNVDTLGYAWSYDLDTTLGLEATPVVVNGVMYASAPWGVVHAVDARTGKRLWRFDPKVEASIA